MNKTLKFFHLLGLVMFLGSIFVYTLMSILTAEGELRDLLFAREVIRAGTLSITAVGLWMLVVTGGLLAARRFGFAPPWIRRKLALAAVILLLAHLFIIPATAEALAAVRASLGQGALNAAYAAAYLKETLPGVVNVVLTLLAAAIAVRRAAT